MMLSFVWARLTRAMTFDQRIHTIQFVSEALLSLLFLIAFLMDIIPSINVDSFFISTFLLILLTGAYLAFKIRGIVSERFLLSRVDIFSYISENEVLRMMIALHQLIEASGYSARDDFILRGFVERHIEICDFPSCNCLDYYKLINSSYRLQLATVASMKEQDDHSKISRQNSNNQTRRTTNEEEGTQADDISVAGGQSTFFVQSNNLVRPNKAKSQFMHSFLVNNIKVFIDLFPNSLKLRYMSAFIYYSLFKNSFKALYELSHKNSLLSSKKQQSESSGFAFIFGCGKGGDPYNSYTLGLKIIHNFANQSNQFITKDIIDAEIDLTQIIEFEKLNIKYQKSIERTSEIAEKFWNELSKNSGLNIDTIFNHGATINSRFHRIKIQYKKLMTINQNYLEVAYLYKLFVQLCLNFELEESEAKLEITKILQSKGMRKRNLRLEYSKVNYADENGMIIISGCQKDFSKILAMNNKAERIFGYSTAELIDQPLQKLQPIVYSKTPNSMAVSSAHDIFIMNYINSQKRRDIRKEQHRFVWGRHKSGFIMPIVMDISPYVTFDHNLCFISFCKRSILLEMTPLKEIIDAQDVFVLLADTRGIITDMTRNVTDWLGFPQAALQRKEVSLEQVFESILDEDCEKDFMEGKRLDFFMNSFKDAIDDYDNMSEFNDIIAAEGGLNAIAEDMDSTLYIKDKKCRALVWMKIYDYNLGDQPTPGGRISPREGNSAFVSLGGPGGVSHSLFLHALNTMQVREIWFVLLEEEATTVTATVSILDSKNTHDTAMQEVMDKEEFKFTYQEDREEISSLASISSLAGYNSTDKGLINKLSEIKTSTAEDQKPQSITLLQQSLVGVFVLSVMAAIAMLSLSLLKSQTFYQEIQLMNSSKFALFRFQNMLILNRELVNLANGDQGDFTSFLLSTSNGTQNNSAFLQEQILLQTEQFKSLMLDLQDPNYQQSTSGQMVDSQFNTQQVPLQYVRNDGLVYIQQKKQVQLLYELITAEQTVGLNNVGQAPSQRDLNLSRDYLNSYMQVNYNSSVADPKLSNLSDLQRQVYFLLNNSHQPQIKYYPMLLSNFIVDQADQNIDTDNNAILIITVIAITITLITAGLVIPIVLRIESNKEKVFFIYAELSPNDIDDRKRNIRVFFAKLRQSTLNPGGSLFYEKSSRIVSSKLLTRRFSNKEENNSQAAQPLNGGLVRQSGRVTGGNSISQSGKEKKAYGSFINPNNVDYEEDLQAEIMKQKEEQEAATFKKFFHARIKTMSFVKKVKHVALVLVIVALVQAYFIVKRSLILNIDNTVHDSIAYYKIISARQQYFGQLIAEYRESYARNVTFQAPFADQNTQSAVDYFLQATLNNEKSYNQLRQNIPSILQHAAPLIQGLEGIAFCNTTNSILLNSNCPSVLNGILNTGLTQTINSMLQYIIQSQISFSLMRSTQQNLQKVIADNSIRGIIYLKIIYLDSAFEAVVVAASTSIKNHIQTMEKTLIIYFTCFVLLMLVCVTLTATIGMNYLFRNFNATKSILNFIPGKCLIELSSRTDLTKIQF